MGIKLSDSEVQEKMKKLMEEEMKYADAPESGEVIKDSIIERLFQELEKRTVTIEIQVQNLQKQFKPILMDKSASVGRDENPTEKYPAYSPFAKRIETLIELHKEIAYQLDVLEQDSEI
jgi:hypothetical protein